MPGMCHLSRGMDARCHAVETGDTLFQLTNHRHHFALDAYICGGQEHFRIAGIGRSQPHLIAFKLEVLERRFVLGVEPGGDHFTVFRPLLMAEDDDIPVQNAGVNHRITLHAQSI